jgi:hypothetical protein
VDVNLQKIDRGRYGLIIIDAWYRILPAGTDENSNATMAILYNQLDCIADKLATSFALVHHASKGDQSGKAVTDVGAGAGSQSRATDTHLILRAHEEDKAVVLDAAVRSWEPVDARCLRWSFPIWAPAPDLDPTALRTTGNRSKPKRNVDEPEKPAEPPWTAQRFAEVFGRSEPRARDVLLEDARLVGLSDSKAEKLLKSAVGCGHLFSWKEAGANSKTMVATVRPPETPPAPPSSPEKKTKNTAPAKPKRSRRHRK